MNTDVEYIGHFVDDPDELLRQHPPQISEVGKVYAHHVTKEHLPEDGIASIELGKKRVLHATGAVVTPEIHALLVHDPTDDSISTNKYPHITIATAPGVSPVSSNMAIEKAKRDGTVIAIDPPLEIRTTEGYSDGENTITE